MAGSRRPPSVRVRILAAVLVTTTFGMIAAGLASYLIARQAVYQDIQNDLRNENAEFKAVAKLAESGQGGRPIRAPGDVLYVAIKGQVPDPDEGILGLVGTRVAWIPGGGEEFQRGLVTDSELIAAAAAVQPDQPVVVNWISTSRHQALAFVSIPVEVRGSTELGHYVAVIDVAAALAPIQRTHLTYALIGLIALLLVGIVGYQVAGRLLAPLRSLQQTAQRINETDLSDRIPADQLASNDEVADLGRTMNAMLDRLAASFDNQRQVLDDSAHELRTPITIIRGHLELLDVADPADVTRTRALALDELERMQRLVEELLLLAKSRRPDFVRPEPVVVAELLHSVLDKVIPLADRDWRLEAAEVDAGSTDDLVWVDRGRLTQALVQLVANAIRHTETGAVIAIGAGYHPSEVEFWVRDTGTGIAPADQERIFERFRRASDEPGQESGRDLGVGLGLPIVAAIAAAHNGEVLVSSVPGQGAKFVLRLPQPASARLRTVATK